MRFVHVCFLPPPEMIGFGAICPRVRFSNFHNRLKHITFVQVEIFYRHYIHWISRSICFLLSIGNLSNEMQDCHLRLKSLVWEISCGVLHSKTSTRVHLSVRNLLFGGSPCGCFVRDLVFGTFDFGFVVCNPTVLDLRLDTLVPSSFQNVNTPTDHNHIAIIFLTIQHQSLVLSLSCRNTPTNTNHSHFEV